MIKNFTKQFLTVTLSVLVIFGTTPLDAQQTGSSGYSGQGVPLTPAELQALVAPIALYPDALVAQILSAATFPDQVAYSQNWIQTNPELTGSTLMMAVNDQNWDPSVKALSQFPSVLANMAKNLSWTSSLGEAYSTQAADVMTAVQTLRAKAYAAGNLVSSTQLCRAGVASSHRDSTCESASGLRSRVQPRSCVRLPLCGSRLRCASPSSFRCRGRDRRLWSWYRGRCDDEQQLLRLGL